MSAVARWLTKLWLKQCAYVAVLFNSRDAALGCYRRLVALDPNDAAARSTLGNLLMERGDAEGAAGAFEELVARAPSDAEGWFNLGYIHEHGERLADAERCFRRAVELWPKLDRAWYGLGLVLIRMGRLREATAALAKNIEIQPFSPYGYYQLAMTHHHLGEAAEARRIYDKLKTFEPRFAATLNRDLENTPPRGEVARNLQTRPQVDHEETIASAQ